MNWAVGITTAPRPTPTLEQAIAGLVAAGWDRMTIFAEPDSALPKNIDTDRITVVQRLHRKLLFHNWRLALSHLLINHPEADAILLCQDDTIYCRDLRQYLERTLWPAAADQVALCSPYCPSPYRVDAKQKPRPEGWHVEHRGFYLVGALCWAIPRQSAVRLTEHLAYIDADNQIDGHVGKWASETGRVVYYHRPSLVQHTGKNNSAQVRCPHETSLRQAWDFIGTDAVPDSDTKKDAET